MIDPQEFGRRVLTEKRFVALKRFNFDIGKLVERYPDGCPTHVIASALLVSEEDVEQIWQNAVEHLQELLGVKRFA